MRVFVSPMYRMPTSEAQPADAPPQYLSDMEILSAPSPTKLSEGGHMRRRYKAHRFINLYCQYRVYSLCALYFHIEHARLKYLFLINNFVCIAHF